MTYQPISLKKAPTITITNASLSYNSEGFPYYYYTLTSMNVRVSVELTSPYPGGLTSFRLITPNSADINVGDFIEIDKDVLVTPSVDVYLPGEMSPAVMIYGAVTIQKRYTVTSTSPSIMFDQDGVSFSGDTFSFYYPSGSLLWNGGSFYYPDITIDDTLVVNGATTFNSHATLAQYMSLKVNKYGSILLNADHAYADTPSVDAYIYVQRESSGKVNSSLYWDESELTWTFNRGDNKYQALFGTHQLYESNSFYLYNANGTKQYGIAGQTRYTHTQTEKTITGSPAQINFTVDNASFSVGDSFEIVMDNSTGSLTLPVWLTKDATTEYKFWLPSSFVEIAQSSNLVTTLKLDVPSSGSRHVYRFNLTRSWTNTYSGGWSLTSNTYWSVSRYNGTFITDLNRPSKHLTYDNVSVKNALDTQDLTIHGKVHVNGSVSYSLELGTAGETYSLSDHDLNYVTDNSGGPVTLYLSTDPRTCIGRQHRIIMGVHSGTNHTYIKVYKQTATIGVLDHATEYELVSLTVDYSSVTLMAVRLAGGVAWMPLTSSGNGVTRTDASIASQFPA